MGEKYFGYQIWKPKSFMRKGIKEQMQINNRFISQPLAENYELVSDEILDTSKHYELKKGTPGFSTTIWDMAENYKNFKKDFNFEIGDAIVIYHTFIDGKKSYPSILIVGHYLYGWKKDGFDFLRDFEPVQESWKKAINSTPIVEFEK